MPVRVNRAVVEHEIMLIVGPVFSHEVVGFSGGNKYMFPGVSGREFIDLSIARDADHQPEDNRHRSWPRIGARPDRRGDPVSSWAAAADVSAASHIRYLDAPVDRALSVNPLSTTTSGLGSKGSVDGYQHFKVPLGQSGLFPVL